MNRSDSSRIFLIVSACLYFGFGCGDDTPAQPSDIDGGTRIDGTSGDQGTDLTPDTGLETVALETGALSLRVLVDPFGFVLRNSAGQVLLETVYDPVDSLEGSADGAYGPPAATWNEAAFADAIASGYDNYIGVDQPWTRFDRTISASSEGGAVEVRLGTSDDSGAELLVALSVTENRLDVTAQIDAAHEDQFNRLGQSFVLGEDAHFFGLGERFVSVDHRGMSLTCWTERGGVGLGEGESPGPDNPSPNGAAMTPFPVPFLINTQGYGLWLRSDHRSAFHLGSHTTDLWRVETSEPVLSYTVFVNSDPRKTIGDYLRLTGLPPLPPLWTFGPRRHISPDSTVFEMPEWRALREFGIPTTTIDHDLAFLPVGEDAGQTEALGRWAVDVHSWGYRLLGRFSPHLASGVVAVENDFERAERNGFLVRDEDGETLLLSLPGDEGVTLALVDFTQESAVAWYRERMQAALDLGYDGWRLEHGEYTSLEAVFGDGRLGAALHNPYPALVQAVVADFLDEMRPEDGFLAARSGYAGSSQHLTAVWSGEANTSFEETDGLPSVVRAGINLGLSGVPYFGSDIGGHHVVDGAQVDRELYLRWAGFAALTPQMHDEGIGDGSDDDPARWSIWNDQQTIDAYRQFALLHTRLGLYFRMLAQVAHERGWPLIRHTYLQHPSDRSTIQLDDQYFLGDAILVAPVVERGVDGRSVYFPEGTYVDWTASRVVIGPGTVDVDLPLRAVPAFIADGAIIPMLDESIETLAAETSDDVVGPTDVADVLDVRVVRTSGEAAVTLVDGTSLSVSITSDIVPPLVAAEVMLPLVVSHEERRVCDGCFLVEEGAPNILWVTTPLAESSEVTATGITLIAVNPMGQPRRIRWEIILPGPFGIDTPQE